jgi:hypothetical protein
VTKVVRTSIIAVLALVASLLGFIPAQALPSGSTPLFAAGPSATPDEIRPLGRTSAGLVTTDGSGALLSVTPAGGTPALDTRFTFASVIGDLIYQRNWSDGTISWRTIADATLRTHTPAAGDTYLAGAPAGYIAQRGSAPYQLVRVTLATGAATVLGTSTSPFQSVQAGSAGVAATTSSSAQGSYLWFPYGSSGTGQPVTVPAGSSSCQLAGAFLYCSAWTGTAGRLHRVALPGGTTTTVDFNSFDIVETSTGVAFLTSDPASSDPLFTLWSWPTSASAPTQRIAPTFGLAGDLAPGVAGTVLASRSGAVGQGGIWSIPLPTGTSTLLQAAPAAPRAGTDVAIGPGGVLWADNNRSDGAVWTRDISGSGALTSTERLVASNATGSTLSISGDRFTFTQGASRFNGTRLLDGTSATALNESGISASLSGDRLLYQSRVVGGQDVQRPWSLRDLRTGAVTPLADAVDYDLWGERLARLDADGSVWVSNLRTGSAPTLLRTATPAGSLFGTVHVAGDTVLWDVSRSDDGQTWTDETKVRDVQTLAPATDLAGLGSATDLSTGYALGSYCDGSGCGFVAVSLGSGQATPFENISRAPAVDGNLVAYLGQDSIPAVVALPAYADAPRLLAAPAAGTSLPSGGSWTARVVASRVLSACAVEIRNSANTLVRSLSCTDSNAATTVSWNGRDTGGALVPAGSYSWRIVGNTGGAALVDYDGSSTALSGTVSVAGVSGPAVTAQSPVVNGTSAAVSTNITATFSKAVQGVSATTFTLRNAAGTLIGRAVTYNATTRVATLNPSVNLTPDTRYTATLTGGTTAIRDGANVPLATTSWTFTTGPAPTATTLSPASNGTSFAVTGNPSAVFSEGVTGVSGTSFTLATAGGTPVPAAVTYAATTRRATLNPTADLAPDTRYTLTLTGGPTAIRDAAGNPLVTRSWSFTTGPAPTVTSRSPATGATGVVNTANVTAVFSEAVQGVSGTTFRLRNPAGTVVSAVVTYDPTTRTATLNPSANLVAATRYTVGLAGSTTAIRDAAGNPLTTVTWTFTTR